MSLSIVLGNALSGLSASQTVLRTVADNVANVNTPGYVRKVADLQSRTANGAGAGVEVAQLRRAADIYLRASSLSAIGKMELAETRATALDQLQAGFGDPSDSGSLFGRINGVLGQFNAASVDPSLLTTRRSIIGDMTDLFSEMNRLGREVQNLRGDADSKIASAVARVNELLSNISTLNGEILRTNVAGGDSSGAEDQMDQMLNELAKYMDVRVQQTDRSGVVVRTNDGVFLAGDGAAQLSYTARGSVTSASAFEQIMITNATQTDTSDLNGHIAGGELRGLLDLRDIELPYLANELGALSGQMADELNRVHTGNAAVPAVNSLEGRVTGLASTDSHGFTGATTVAITDADGLLVRRVDINFSAGTLSVNGGAASSIGTTVGSLSAALNSALGSNGNANFSGGQLTITATDATHGVATLDNDTTPSDRGGRGFAHFFGLNELVHTERPMFFETGVQGSDAHGFVNGSTVSFGIYSESGAKLRDVTYTMSGTTIDDMILGLNNLTTGVGAFATFALDDNGRMSVTMSPAYADGRVKVSADSTNRGSSGLSFSQVFGIGDAANAGRADALAIRDDIVLRAQNLSLAKLNMTSSTAVNTRVLSPGDGSGASDFQDIASTRGTYARNITERASALAGELGRRSAAAGQTRESTNAVLGEITNRRSSAEGVNLDEEMVNMTIFQQAYTANARLVQAANEMFETLTGMI